MDSRLALNSFGNELPTNIQTDIISAQTVIEKKVEAALVADGFNPNSIVENRHQIRSVLFYPRGTVLSRKTYINYVKHLDSHGTRASIPYRNIKKALDNCELFL